VTWTCRLARNAVLHELAPPRTGKRGRPRLKGARLGKAHEIAETATWQIVTVTAYRGQRIKHVAAITCLWYGSWRTRTVQLILTRDAGTTSGCDFALVTTDLKASAATLVQRYAARWGEEQAYGDARNVLGTGEARNRVKKAVERTVPFGMLVHTLIIVWFTRYGHDPADIAGRRAAQPWYTTKEEPAFEDMLIKLRRVMIAARFSAKSPATPTSQEIAAVLTAWETAAAQVRNLRVLPSQGSSSRSFAAAVGSIMLDQTCSSGATARSGMA